MRKQISRNWFAIFGAILMLLVLWKNVHAQCPPPVYEPIPQTTITDLSVTINSPDNITIEFTSTNDTYPILGHQVWAKLEYPGEGPETARWEPLVDMGRGTAMCEDLGNGNYRIVATHISFGFSDIFQYTNMDKGFFISSDLGNCCDYGPGEYTPANCNFYNVFATGYCNVFTGMEGDEINTTSSTTRSWPFTSETSSGVTSPYQLTKLTDDSINHSTISVEGDVAVWWERTATYNDPNCDPAMPEMCTQMLDLDIVAYDFSSQTEIARISRTGIVDDLAYGAITSIGIDGGRIAWGENHLGDWGTEGKVYLYDLNQIPLAEPVEVISNLIGWGWVPCVDIFGNHVVVMMDGVYDISLDPMDPNYYTPFSFWGCPSIYGNRVASSEEFGNPNTHQINLYENIFGVVTSTSLFTVTQNEIRNCVTLEGNSVVYVNGNNVYLYNLLTGINTIVAEGNSPIVNMRAMDANHIVFSDQGELYIVTLPEEIVPPLPISCNDNDGDGYGTGDSCLGPDCDDNDATVNPGVPEIPYNGKDDDCNAVTPDDDLDGDGYALANDCDDNDATVNPDAREVCDGVDNNCDGSVDDSYVFGGFLQPINSDDSSIFKAERIIPVKISLLNCSGNNVTSVSVSISIYKITSTIEGTEEELDVEASGNANTDNIFRVADDHYIYNLSTKNFSVGTYRVYANMDNGDTYSVKFSLK